jgi:Helix-turn-helix domain
MAGQLPGEMRIGKVLQDARRRAGLDIRTVEERTKIRIKYLRALEGEDWDALPSPAYAKGYLRTYAQLLGLDAEALVDEFRRQVEPARGSTGYPLGDKVLESRRRRYGDRDSGPRVWQLLAAAALAVLVALLVIGLTGSDDDQRPERQRRSAGEGRGGGKGGSKGERPKGTVKLALSIVEPVEVCLLGGGGEALIDGQVLAAGTEEAYERRKFELRFPKGFDGDQFKLEIGGKKRLLPKTDGPAAYRIVAPQRVRAAPKPGEKCP